MQTLPPSCVRTAPQTVRLAWAPVITASAVQKGAINSFSTRGSAGRIAQSKQLADLSVFPPTELPPHLICLLNLTFRGFFETAEGSCEACDSSCLTCDGIKSQCLSCPDGYYLGNGMCRLNCSLRTYPADDGTCRRCPSHCDVCSDDRTCFSELFVSS